MQARHKRRSDARCRFIAAITQAQAFRAQSLKAARWTAQPPPPALSAAADDDLSAWAGVAAARDALDM